MATYGLKSITVGSNTYEMNTKNALGISLNGGSLSFDGSTANQSVSFYAPIAAGSSGKVIGWDATNSRPAWIDAPNGGLQNLVDGSAAGSVRGINTTAESSSYTIGVAAVAEGVSTNAPGYASHAEGASSYAFGAQSHAEGYDTYAGGNSSHTEGIQTNADGEAAHAEGLYSGAVGNYSHASGLGSIAYGRSTFVIGEYNYFTEQNSSSERGDCSFVIGGGEYGGRSNIFAIDWIGNINTAGTTINMNYGERILNTADYVDGYLSNNGNSFSIYVVNYSDYEERYELAISSSNNTLSSFNIYKTDDYGAGTRVNLGSIPTSITLNGSANTAPSFYAPTTAGTSGYVLKSNGSGSPTWTSAELTDTKLAISAISAFTSGTYYPIIATDSTAAAMRQYDNDGFEYYALNGTSGDISSDGQSRLTLGNNKHSSSASKWKRGILRLYGTTANYVELKTADGYPTANKTITIPNATGIMALTSDIPTITLNRSTTTTPSFYAPTVSGTSGKIIGWDTTNSVPVWIDAPNTGIQNLVDGTATGSVRGVGTQSDSGSHALGMYAFAEGDSTWASGYAAHAEGSTTAATGSYAHAEGGSTTASGLYSHAEGRDTIASGLYSHAEGMSTTASGYQSHAEGDSTTASGTYSHAEGYNTTAYGQCTHAGGCGTIAHTKSQTVIGEYNILDTGSTITRGAYAFIIGKGTSDNARSNALTVSWDGDTVMAGGLDVSGVDHTITTTEYQALMDAIDAI